MIVQPVQTFISRALLLGAFVFFAVAPAREAVAQLGPGVKYHQKISDTEGGFTGLLDNADRFSITAEVGDLDGDGVFDLAVGAPYDDDGGLNRGAVWLLFLNSDGTVASHKKISDTEGGFVGELGNSDNFGFGLVSLGDVDGDSVDDLAVSALGDDDGGNNWGAVWILFMNEDETVKAHQKISSTEGGFTGVLANDCFGYSMTALGDFDGDGVPDLAVGAPWDDNSHGAFWLLFLNADGTVKSHQKISETEGGFSGDLDDDTFGLAAYIGDLDGDGVGDLAVGAPWDDDGGFDRGAVWVLFLNAVGTVKSHQKISDTEGSFTGELTDEDYFGESVVGIGDHDGDGVEDVAVGALFDDDGGPDCGALWLLFLNVDGTVKSHQKISNSEGTFYGTLNDGDWFSFTPAPVGDLDGDGILDLAVGAYGDGDGGPNRGAVWILFLTLDVAGVDDAEAGVPSMQKSRLVAGVPNPFNPRTTIQFDLARPGSASLRIYDVAGRLVRSFDLGNRPAGPGSLEWNGKDDRGEDVTHGIYMVKLIAPDSRDAMQLTVVK